MDNVSMNQALQLWSELIDAYYEKNNYGGNVAEIYAYSLMPYVPTYAQNKKFDEWAEDIEIRTSKTLYNFLKKFKEDYNCKIFIEYNEFGDWLLNERFSHRVHIKIEKILTEELA
jgi:hypothetical protein